MRVRWSDTLLHGTRIHEAVTRQDNEEIDFRATLVGVDSRTVIGQPPSVTYVFINLVAAAAKVGPHTSESNFGGDGEAAMLRKRQNTFLSTILR